ncbi:hypothetical protein [Pseudorhizobium banfieldiae]|nr:hypothetical protein [Pseudorhizobium banfieldiae]CAD6605836.1 hypothetical protein RNT25_01734 [arsenite-oxidising bacterium NT-25]
MIQPLCRYCGKPLRKSVVTVALNSRQPKWRGGISRPDRPSSKEEAQRLFNEVIVSLRYGEDERGRYVSEVGLWDGVTYRDRFFCKGEHAQQFAYSALNYAPTLGTASYHEALKAQQEKEQS